MADLLIIGALGLDRPIRLSGPLAVGARLTGSSLGGTWQGRLGGGAANAGAALAAAGHSVRVAALVAADADGEAAMALAADAGIDLDLVIRSPGPSRTTLILLEPNGERVVISLDAPADPAGLPSLPTPADHPQVRPVGLFVRAAYPGAGAWAARCAGPVVVHWPSAYRGPADVVTASAEDLDATILADPFAAAQAVFGERLRCVVVTQGRLGARAYEAQGELRASAPPALVRDATGAGDVFAAGMLDALVAGADTQAALVHACAWGAAAVGLDSSAPVGAFAAF